MFSNLPLLARKHKLQEMVSAVTVNFRTNQRSLCVPAAASLIFILVCLFVCLFVCYSFAAAAAVKQTFSFFENSF